MGWHGGSLALPVALICQHLPVSVLSEGAVRPAPFIKPKSQKELPVANPKNKPEEIKPPVAAAPNSAQAGAVTGDGTGTALPAHEGGAAIGAVGDSTSAADAGGTSDMVDLTLAANGEDGGQVLPELGSTDVTSINDAAFAQVMKRFVSQGKTVVVKGPEKGRWRAGGHFTIVAT